MQNLSRAQSHVGEGGITVSGTAFTSQGYEYVGQGGINVGGTAFNPNEYYYVGDGVIEVEGEATGNFHAVAPFGEISMTLSGGLSNRNTNLSLGGFPSFHPVSKGLFRNIAPGEQQGKMDYRCIYVFNQSVAYTLEATRIFIESQVPGGADVEIGAEFKTDVQRIVVTGTPSGGDMTLTYVSGEQSESVTANYHGNTEQWRANVEGALRSITGLEDVTVQVGQTSGVTMFTVLFTGSQNYRYHELLEVEDANLVGGTASVAKIQDGSPVNAVAPSVPSELSSPSGVQFLNADNSAPIQIGKLLPGDGLPVWIKRKTPRRVQPLTHDGFQLKVEGQPVTTNET
jgi:hypothetical protein